MMTTSRIVGLRLGWKPMVPNFYAKRSACIGNGLRLGPGSGFDGGRSRGLVRGYSTVGLRGGCGLKRYVLSDPLSPICPQSRSGRQWIL